MAIEEKLSLGLTSVHIIIRDDPTALIQYLRSHDYGVTSVDGEGATGKVKLINTIIRRQDLAHVVGIIKDFHPSAFYSVEENSKWRYKSYQRLAAMVYNNTTVEAK